MTSRHQASENSEPSGSVPSSNGRLQADGDALDSLPASTSGALPTSAERDASAQSFDLDFDPTKGPVESEANSPADLAADARKASPASLSSNAPKQTTKTREIGRDLAQPCHSNAATAGETHATNERPHVRHQRRRRSVAPLISADLVLRHVRVQPHEVVFLKGVLEASEGLASVFAEHGGELTIATTPGQQHALDQVLRDLGDELGILLARDFPAGES